MFPLKPSRSVFLSLLGDNTCLLLCHVLQSSRLPSCFNLLCPLVSLTCWTRPVCVPLLLSLFILSCFIIALDSVWHSHTICIHSESSRNTVKVLVRNSVCNWNGFTVWKHLTSVYCLAFSLLDANNSRDEFMCFWKCLENYFTGLWNVNLGHLAAYGGWLQ